LYVQRGAAAATPLVPYTTLNDLFVCTSPHLQALSEERGNSVSALQLQVDTLTSKVRVLTDQLYALDSTSGRRVAELKAQLEAAEAQLAQYQAVQRGGGGGGEAETLATAAAAAAGGTAVKLRRGGPTAVWQEGALNWLYLCLLACGGVAMQDCWHAAAVAFVCTTWYG
jgi:hypothetical protein